ncbi:MAG TPA: acyltransferase family protein [Herpetosiphonaceae bacterium]
MVQMIRWRLPQAFAPSFVSVQNSQRSPLTRERTGGSKMLSKPSGQRRCDLDWLRVLLILTVLVFHSLRLFDLEGWYVKSATTHLSAQALVVFISRWLMPAVFLISGMATFYALGTRRAWRFVKDRALRLLVPLLVGLVTHIPLQEYLKQVSQNQYRGSFWQWYLTTFNGLDRFGGNFNWIGSHLWYLEMLFVFSLVCLPLFLWLRNGTGQRVLTWVGARFAAPGALYLPVLPIILLSATLDPDSNSLLARDEFGGWNLPSHLIFFLSGFVFASSPAMQASMRRIRWFSLVTALVSFFVGVALVLALTGGENAFGTPIYLVWSIASSLSCWAGSLAILGFGMQRLNVRTPVLEYGNEAVLPFYVLHQSILLVVAFYVLTWTIPDLAKWAIILVSTFTLIMVLYELLIRRINLLRVLFGMKPLRPHREVQQVAAASSSHSS